MTTWDERFRRGDYPQDPAPSPVLEHYAEQVAGDRALDVATGTGRNAVYLAGAGYHVDALDRSRVGLEKTLERARDRDVADDVHPIQADATRYAFPVERYDLVTISFYRAVDRLADVKEALVPDGLLFVEHHLRTADPAPVGPNSDRYRFAANELLHACLDLTVLYYDEGLETRPDGRLAATARVVARKSSGPRQSYPSRMGHRADG